MAACAVLLAMREPMCLDGLEKRGTTFIAEDEFSLQYQAEADLGRAHISESSSSLNLEAR